MSTAKPSYTKHAGYDLIEENVLLQAVMNTVLDGVMTIDERGNIYSLNPAAVRIFGYTPEEVIGQNVKMLMPEPYHSEHDSYIHNYVETGKAKVIGIGREVKARRKDGSVFPMELGVNQMVVDDRRMFVGTIRDISERKAAEEERNQYISALKRSNQELDDFAYIASHDLKEPLRGLSNNARFLMEDYGQKLDSQGMKRLRRIGYLCQRMEKLVDDLLYFSRLGRHELAVQEVDLNHVINDVRSMMESTLQEKNAHIILSKPLPTVVCDVPRITEVFNNLISNAVKYNTAKEKQVEIGYTDLAKLNPKEKPRMVLYVKDNGIGIPKEFHEEIFRIFKRLNEEDEIMKGTGVGLTFVRKIIERFGGNIWVESAPGHGSTFYFTI